MEKDLPVRPRDPRTIMSVFHRPARIVLIGPECTGKTQLAQTLAARFRVPWSAEFARLFVESRQRAVEYRDVDAIGRGQLAQEEEAIARAKAAGTPLLFHDTDLASTLIYSRHYFGKAPVWMEPQARCRPADLYLLHSPDVPWTEDPGQREHPERREELFARFQETLRQFGAPVAPIYGPWDMRCKLALEAIRQRMGIVPVFPILRPQEDIE